MRFRLTHNIDGNPAAEVSEDNESHSLEHSLLLLLLHHSFLDSTVHRQVGSKDEQERAEIEDMKDCHGIFPARRGFICDVQRYAHTRTGVEFTVKVTTMQKTVQNRSLWPETRSTPRHNELSSY